MAVSEHARSPESSRKSSVSSGRKSATTRPSTIRTRPSPWDTKRPKTPPNADENSLTSFPSLSPSLNSPVDSPNSTRRFHSLSVPDDPSDTGTKHHAKLEGLFAGSTSAEGRSALFGDQPKNVRQIPGTLHLQSDQNLEHMIRRVGATTLVKRMAEDLAQRDAQITQLQRLAEERETLLRKMLRECSVSNLKIESRLRDLQSQQDQQEQTRKVSGKTQASESSFLTDGSIDEQISAAFVDVLGENQIPSAEPTFQHVSRVHGSGSQTGSPRTSADLSRSNSMKEGTIRKSDARKGWKSLFTPQVNQKEAPEAARKPITRTASARDRLAAIHTASQANLRSKGLSTEVIKPPPPDSDADDEYPSALNKQRKTPDANQDDARSTKSGNSFASWASKLVGGKYQGAESKAGPIDTSKSDSQASSQATSDARKASAARYENSQATSTLSSLARKSAVSTDKVAKTSSNSVYEARNNSQSAGIDDVAANPHPSPGPMEMETILPDHTRPPTLLPYEAASGDAEFLTDRYGFIYDQRRRARQNVPVPTANRSKRSSRLETLENHRRSWNSIAARETDAASLNSHKSNENAEVFQSSPAVESAIDTQAPKRWQDYLTLSGLSTELLSHTPSVAPTTTVITGNDTDEQKPQIKVAERGSIVAPTLTSPAAPSRVMSGDAEFAHVANTESSSNTDPSEQRVDPVKALLDQMTEIHDASQREKETKWNEFLRKIRSDRRRQGEANDRRSKNDSVGPEASLLDGDIIGLTSVGNQGKAGRTKWLEFKSLVLSGVPLSLRPKVWAECSGASALRIPSYYAELTDSHVEDESIVQQIAMDIPRTLTDNIYFRKGDGMGKLSQVLLAYAQRNPEVGYCQGMNLIAANLLLVMPTAEDAFWMLATLVEKILPDKYYDHSLLTSRADQVVLRQYVGTVLPKLSAHLESLSIDLEALTFQWFLSVFTDCLSAEALFRVWDVILCTPSDAGGGATFLFQIALALLKLNEKELQACETSAEVYAYINGHMTDHAISIDGLIKAGEALRRLVKLEEVERKRDMVVQADLDLMRERETIRKGKQKARELEVSTDVAQGKGDDDDDGVKASGKPPSTEFTLRTPAGSSNDEDEEYQSDLHAVSPMPIEEEMQWRG